MIKSLDTAKLTLEALKCKNIESYTLINNYGVTFSIAGRKYDIRYWANSYGTPLNKWIPMAFCVEENREKDEIDDFIYEALNYMFNYSNIKE